MESMLKFRQVIIAAEEPEKRAHMQRALELMFKKSGETDIAWHQVSTIEAAIEQINVVLANLKDAQQSLETIVVMSGFQGQWFEIAGYLKFIELANREASQNKVVFKAALMSSHPNDVHAAVAEGLPVIHTMMPEEAMARFAAQIFLGEAAASIQPDGDTGMGRTDDEFSQETGKEPWEHESFP